MATSDPSWHSLRCEIEQSVALEESTIKLAGRDFTWHNVADPEQVLELAAAGPGNESHDPFWAASWRSAVGMDRFLDRLQLKSTQVLELGCGCGQAGTSAAVRGAFVSMTDAVELALKVARLNSWPVRENVSYHHLVWGKERVPKPAFPIIIGSDIVYDPNSFAGLESCVRQHLADPGTFYVSEPCRQSGDLFIQSMRNAGWNVQQHNIELPDDRPPIRILECKLS